MGMNFQDVIRDVHDQENHQLKTSATVNSNSTVFIGTPTLFAVVNTGAVGVGNSIVTVANPITLNSVVTLSPSINSIGFATVKIGTNVNTNIGLVTVDGGRIGVLGNVTLSDSKGFIGLATVVQASSARTITGNLTLSDSKTYIGLVTATPAWGSEATVYATVISATGNTTLFIAPASNRFFVKDIHVSSLGRSEIQFLSGATVFIPFTSLATTSGFAAYYGEMGKPARAATDALVANLNGGATVSIGVTYRIAP